LRAHAALRSGTLQQRNGGNSNRFHIRAIHSDHIESFPEQESSSAPWDTPFIHFFVLSFNCTSWRRGPMVAYAGLRFDSQLIALM
jgi:hypothetical protein